MILVDSLFEYNNIIFIWWIQFNGYGGEDGDIDIEHWDEDDNSYQIDMNNNDNSAMKKNGEEVEDEEVAHISAHSVILFGRCLVFIHSTLFCSRLPLPPIVSTSSPLIHSFYLFAAPHSSFREVFLPFFGLTFLCWVTYKFRCAIKMHLQTRALDMSKVDQ